MNDVDLRTTEIIPFNYVKSTKNKSGKSVHFYLDDYQFERVWNTPERYMKMLSGFDYVHQPDFSLFIDMPYPVQLYNHYRKQWVAAFWEMNDIRVIPTIGWSDARSFDFCFSGIPVNSVVSVSSVGTQRNKQAKQGFLVGYAEMLKRLNPSKILFYGNIPDEIDRDNIVHIEPFWKNIQERVTKMGGRGTSSGGSNSFVPKRKDDTTDKLSGKTLALSANTITIKGEQGKTVGMVRNISRVSTSNPQDQMLMHKFSRDSGIDIRSFGVENIYKSNGNIYIFNNTKADAVNARLKGVNKSAYNRFTETKRKLREVENAGAYIVNYIKY